MTMIDKRCWYSGFFRHKHLVNRVTSSIQNRYEVYFSCFHLGFFLNSSVSIQWQRPLMFEKWEVWWSLAFCFSIFYEVSFCFFLQFIKSKKILNKHSEGPRNSQHAQQQLQQPLQSLQLKFPYKFFSLDFSTNWISCYFQPFKPNKVIQHNFSFLWTVISSVSLLFATFTSS